MVFSFFYPYGWFFYYQFSYPKAGVTDVVRLLNCGISDITISVIT